MSTSSYEYDVAFSFLAKDESLAAELNDLLQSRIKTFLYSKKQGELAGTDGEKSFGAVFGEKARLVVVLYRQGWGETPWTRIEETSIRNRAFDDGYDFVKFIPLDDPPVVPRYLPKTHLWIGLKRWGMPGAASVIEARVQELGGDPHEENVVDRALRLGRSQQFSARRERFLYSGEGVWAANSAFEAFKIAIEEQINAIRNSGSAFTVEIKQAEQQIVILGRHLITLALSVDRHCQYANSLNQAVLKVTLWQGHPPFPGITHIEYPPKLNSTSFTFDLSPSDQHHWTTSGRGERAYTSEELASFVLKYYMDAIEVNKTSVFDRFR